MEFRSVGASSNIRGLNYDRERRVLTVEFTNGSRYAYQDVDEEVYTEFLEASSPGTYFADNVKGAYAYARVS